MDPSKPTDGRACVYTLLMVYFGKVKNGRIELDPPSRLPEGAVVRIEPVTAETDPADGLADEAVDMGVEDLAAQHDHYIYNTPKRQG